MKQTPKEWIPIARPDLSGLEQHYVERALSMNWISQGEYVYQCQEKLKELTGRKYAICCSSGTTALLAAVMVTEGKDYMPPFDRIAVPALTFVAVHNVAKLRNSNITYLGADERNWLPDEKLEAERIIWAPCYGKAKWPHYLETFSGTVIEDAAESFTGSYDLKPAGSRGTISCLSFYANKIVTAGEGGAVLTDDAVLHRRLLSVLNHGIDNKQYVAREVGFNGRMTDLQAAVLLAQLERLPEMLERRRKIEAYYESKATDWFLRTTETHEVCAPWLFAGIPSNPDQIWAKAKSENIEVRPFFPIPTEAPNTYSIRCARRLSRNGICLPLSSALTDAEVERVGAIL